MSSRLPPTFLRSTLYTNELFGNIEVQGNIRSGSISANVIYGNVSGVNIVAQNIYGNLTANSWTPGNVTNLNITGNMTAGYFIGNGSLLTGIAVALPGVISKDINGNVIGAYSNVTTLIGTTGNVGNVRLVGGNVAVSGQINVLGNVVAPFFVGNGSRLTGIATYTLPDIANIDTSGNVIGAYANVTTLIGTAGNVGNVRLVGGNVAVNGQINALGNIVASFFVGNGSQLTGIAAALPGVLSEDIRGNIIGAYANVGNLIAIAATISSAGNANVLTISGTTTNTTGSLIQGTSVRGAVNSYSLLRLNNSAGRVLDIDGSGAITANCTVNSDMVDIRPTNASFSSSALNIQATRSENSAYNFINCKAGDGETSPFVVNGRGDVIAGAVIANTATNANILTVQSLTGTFSNIAIQAIVPRLSFAEYSFFNCRNLNGNLFNIDGRGSVSASTLVDANVLSLYSGSAIQTQPLIQATSVRNPLNAYSFLRCENAGGRMFDLNGRGDLVVYGNINGGNTLSLSCGANADILTVTGTTTNMTGAVIRGTSLRGATAAYSLLRLENNLATLLDTDGRGSTTVTGAVNSNVLTVRSIGGVGFTSDILRVSSNVASGGGYNLIVGTNTTGNVFRVNGSGGVFGVGAFTTSGADYAEMFEWEDGNASEEDRRGMTIVKGNNGFIRVATGNDNPSTIFGVVSTNPSIVGDSKWNEWSGRYLRDKFGSKLSNAVYYIANVSNTEERVRCGPSDSAPSGYEKIVSSEFIQNPAYDPNVAYVSREDRKEWATIGLVGKLLVLPDQVVNPNWILFRTITHADGDVLEYIVK